ncbi:APC family permease [Tsukamurella sp. 8F]|uniref:APC family permease n=1 Tax=unclassified Tsukamurella TaxID=2633480 RepID=UPI0023B8F0E6|nr:MULTISPECIES: APC family permease [unclassified Tsukamurella]MDF0528794.1 APC family permease [Tsukamurella sp. 8J]MDF0586629.1 APC family permease [Tsukamurella sp. 8F]
MTETAPDLHRVMDLRHLVGNGLVMIGPAAAVGILGPLDARSGGAVGTVYVVATAVMALTAISYARMAGAVPRAGSVYSYASVGIGPRAGFIGGWMVLLDYFLVPSVAFLFTGIALHSAIPQVPAWVFSAGALVVATVLNLAGVAYLARAALVIVVAEVVALALAIGGALAVITSGGAHRGLWTPFTGASGFSPTAVIGAVSVAAVAYLGFDAIATFAEETRGETVLVGRAMVACLALAGLLFVAQSYVAEVLAPVSPAHLAADPSLQGSLYYDTLRSEVAPWIATLLSYAKAVGAAFAGMVGLAAGGRVTMTMARDGRLPRRLSRVSEHSGVPVVATVGVTAVTGIVAVWAANKDDGLDLLSSTVSVGALSAFVLVHASVVGYFRGTDVLRSVVVPVVGIAALIAVLVFADHTAQIVGAVWLAIGVVYMLVAGRVSRTTDAR